MRTIRISDITLSKSNLSFREKSELVKYLDRLGVSVIETGLVPSDMAEILFVKNAASLVHDSILCVPVGIDTDQLSKIWDAMKTAPKKRLQVCIPLSTSQMEYVLHKKPANIVPLVTELVSQCKKLCDDVEFVALDAIRADKSVVVDCIGAAVACGAGTVTLCDSAGSLLPSEVEAFILGIQESVPGLKSVDLGFECNNALGLADACTIAAASCGVQELKVCCHGAWAASLASISQIFSARGDSLGFECSVRNTEIKKILQSIDCFFNNSEKLATPFENGVRKNDTGIILSKNDSFDDVMSCVAGFGYELSEEDKVKVYQSFQKIAAKKGTVGASELEAIIASEAMQVPGVYVLESYSVTCGNTIDILAHVKLKKNAQIMDGISIGNGPIDAAFLAIEKITGCHYELDDFQIQAISQGREAMGQTIVKLRKDGKIYSGHGISTDIVGSGIEAYLSALNKIAWEEEQR